MKNKIFTILLLVFSFYYTNKVVEGLRKIDPLMKEIKAKEEKYYISSIDAIINGNEIIPGKNGKKVDYNKTYNKMKKYGAYNETLTVLKETKPNVSIEDNYDKYLVGGNSKNNNIALVFTVNNNEDITKIIEILKQKKITATFFIDGTYLENNIEIIKNNLNQEFEILSYKNNYKESFFKTSISYLESITNKKAKYCYTKTENNELLMLCKKMKLHTIKPTIHIKNNLYSNIKKSLNNSIIISLDINNYVEEELKITIDLIKSKGYIPVRLDTLVSET